MDNTEPSLILVNKEGVTTTACRVSTKRLSAEKGTVMISNHISLRDGLYARI